MSVQCFFPLLVICVFLHFPDCTVLPGTKHPFKSVRNKALIKNAESGPSPPY